MQRRVAGFGLIEVLITLLVFSIGILGVAGLQAVARKNTYEALQRTTAAWLAHSIIASMRANSAALEVYAYSYREKKNSGSGSDNTQSNGETGSGQSNQKAELRIPAKAVLGYGKSINNTANCYKNPCSPEELARFDLRLWARSLLGKGQTATVTDGQGDQVKISTGGLNSPTACIFGPGGSGIYTVVIAWRGVVERDDKGAHPCGQGSGYYSAPGSSGTSGTSVDASYQRALVVKTYIAAPS